MPMLKRPGDFHPSIFHSTEMTTFMDHNICLADTHIILLNNICPRKDLFVLLRRRILPVTISTLINPLIHIHRLL